MAVKYFKSSFSFWKVFQLCVHDDSERVNSEDLINFIELVAELEGGEDAVDPTVAQMVVNKIMKTQENIPTTGTEKGIDEKQFFDKSIYNIFLWAKYNYFCCSVKEYDLAITFLPLLYSE